MHRRPMLITCSVLVGQRSGLRNDLEKSARMYFDNMYNGQKTYMNGQNSFEGNFFLDCTLKLSQIFILVNAPIMTLLL